MKINKNTSIKLLHKQKNNNLLQKELEMNFVNQKLIYIKYTIRMIIQFYFKNYHNSRKFNQNQLHQKNNL